MSAVEATTKAGGGGTNAAPGESCSRRAARLRTCADLTSARKKPAVLSVSQPSLPATQG